MNCFGQWRVSESGMCHFCVEAVRILRATIFPFCCLKDYKAQVCAILRQPVSEWLWQTAFLLTSVRRVLRAMWGVVCYRSVPYLALQICVFSVGLIHARMSVVPRLRNLRFACISHHGDGASIHPARKPESCESAQAPQSTHNSALRFSFLPVSPFPSLLLSP